MAQINANSKQKQLLDLFKSHDEKGSGRVSQETLLRLFGRLGLEETDVTKVIDASHCGHTDATGAHVVEYEQFLAWLTGGARAPHVMDAGMELPLDSASAARLPSGGFGSWIDRCARLLETRGEADFIQKKLIAAQVRAHLECMEEAEPAGPPRMERSKSRKNSVPPVASTLPIDGPTLMQKLLRGDSAGLPVDLVEQVLDSVMANFPVRFPKPLVRVRVPAGGRLLVVGDTHGQLQDVLLIFLLHGLPSSRNVYIFNGDVADRGHSACEIFILIFVLLLSKPGTVVLTRGNHEDENMNMMTSDQGGGFYDECRRKYGEAVYWKFVDVFKLLPLAAVVHDEVFVVHGGLPAGPPPTLKDIEAIPHSEVCCPAPDAKGSAERLFLDLLWSDPCESPGHAPNPRGAGTLWGPDVTKAFLEKNDLRWIIRSHELPHDGERGWMEHHLGLVFTVFSASNYCGYELNWGAVAVLTVGTDGRVEQALREYNVPGLAELSEVIDTPEGEQREERCIQMGLSWIDKEKVVVGQRRVQLALRRLGGYVLEYKPELWQEFRKRDEENLGTIPRYAWVESLTKICGDDLPWAEASNCWIDSSEETVDYRKFLSRFRVALSRDKWCGWKSLVITDVYEELLSRNAAAQDMLQLLDPTGTGTVSAADFMTLVNECSGGCLSEPQVAALSRTIFAHSRGQRLNVHEFLSRFTLAFVQSKGMAPLNKDCPLASVSTTIEQIGKLIVRARPHAVEPRPPDACPLQRFTSQPAAVLRTSELAPPAPTSLGARSVSDFSQMPGPPQLCREHSPVWLKAFEFFNDAGDGYLQVDEFVRHVTALPGFQDIRHDGKPLDKENLRNIGRVIAASQSENETINLLQFAQAFVAVDSSGNTELADDLHEHILTFLFRHRDALRTSCTERDLEGAGRISKKEFAQVLEAVNFCASRPSRHLTRAQMVALVESISEDDGTVEHEAFLSSFEVYAD